MKLGKKIAFGCLGAVVIGVLSITGLFLLVSAKKSKYDRLAIPFFADAIPALSTWDREGFDPYWAAEIRNGIEPERMDQLFGMYQKLGRLESYEEPQFLQVTASTSNPYGSFVTYSVVADYENADAYMTFVLVPTTGDGLKIWRLQISSDAFLDPVPQ